ncbi:Lrp/AsnC family transcriptional regulator [Parapedomonas caeni]
MDLADASLDWNGAMTRHRMDGSPHGGYEFDDVDRRIVEILKRNGRATNQQIARRLSLAPATVSARIRRMEQANALRVVAVSDFNAYGYEALMAIAVEVQGRPAEDVAADLSALPEVFGAHLVTGRYEIELLVALQSMDDLPRFLLEAVSAIPGIRNLSPAIAVDVVKYKFDIAPITERGGQ